MKCPFKNSIVQHCYATGDTITTSREPTDPPHWTEAKEQEWLEEVCSTFSEQDLAFTLWHRLFVSYQTPAIA